MTRRGRGADRSPTAPADHVQRPRMVVPATEQPSKAEIGRRVGMTRQTVIARSSDGMPQCRALHLNDEPEPISLLWLMASRPDAMAIARPRPKRHQVEGVRTGMAVREEAVIRILAL